MTDEEITVQDASSDSRRISERGDRRSVAFTVCLALMLVIGFGLRFWKAGDPPIFMDEVHAIRAARSQGYGEILTSYAWADSSIPLTLWNRLLYRTTGITELGVRLPGLVFGCVLLLVVAAAARRRLPPTLGLLLVGLLAISPWLVYVTREARPYPVCYALFAAAVWLAHAWWRGAARSRLIAAAVAAASSIWFHPIVLPAIGALSVAGIMVLAWKRRLRERLTDLAVAAATFTVLFVALMGPALPELVKQLEVKKDIGNPSLDMVEGALLYLHGFPASLSLWFFWLPVLLLASFLLRRAGVRCWALWWMTAAQVATLWLVKPWLVEVPWIFLRYVGHLLPFFTLLAAAPLAFLVDRFARAVRVPSAAPVAVAALVMVAAGLHAWGGRYTLGPEGALNQNPEVMLIDDDAAAEVIGGNVQVEGMWTSGEEIHGVYEMLAAAPQDGAVLEVPLMMVFPLYEWYRRVHRRPVRMGAIGVGEWMTELLEPDNALDLEHFVGVQPLDPGALEGVSHVVFHKRPAAELVTFAMKCSELPLYGRHMVSVEEHWGMWEVEFGFDVTEYSVPSDLDAVGEVVHDGPWLRVYEVRHDEGD